MDDLLAVEAILEAASQGLNGVPKDWQELFVEKVANLGPSLTAEDARLAAADVLRLALDDWFVGSGADEKLWRWGCKKFPTLPAVLDRGEFVNVVLDDLHQVVTRYQNATGYWAPERGHLFPVRPATTPKELGRSEGGFDWWVKTYTIRAAGRAVDGGRQELPVGPEDLAGRPDEVRPGPSGRVRFDALRVLAVGAMVTDRRVLSPDLVSRVVGGAERQATVRAAGLVAVGGVLDFLDELTDVFLRAEKICTEAVREIDSREGDALDQYAKRMVPDVLFAVSEALGIAGEQLVSSRATPVKATVALAVSQWRCAQLKPLAELLFEPLRLEVAPGRVDARVQWAAVLVADCAAGWRHPATSELAANEARRAVKWLTDIVTDRTLDRRIARIEVAEIMTVATGGSRQAAATGLVTYYQALRRLTRAARSAGDAFKEKL